MRKQESKSDYGRKEKSLYQASDYRSRDYHGVWEKAWLRDVAENAVINNISLYEAMWRGYEDKREHMPRNLFKFFPFNHNSIKCIEQNTVFVNNPKNFNDPFDSRICSNESEFIKKCLVTYLRNTDAVQRGILSEAEFIKLEHSRCESSRTVYRDAYPTFDSVVNDLCYDSEKEVFKRGSDEIYRISYGARKKYKEYLEKIRESVVKISSFANIDNFKLISSIELWSHYAQNHEGFCVEYDLSNQMNDTHENAMVSGALLPCEYGAKQILLSKSKFYKYANEIPFTPHEKMEFDKSIILSFLKKSSSWRYENEWRLILPIDICEIYENMIPFFPIKAIYLGCRMSEDNREYLYRVAERKKIAVYNMSMQDHYFELDGNFLSVDIPRYFKDKEEKRKIRLDNSCYDLFNME